MESDCTKKAPKKNKPKKHTCSVWPHIHCCNTPYPSLDCPQPGLCIQRGHRDSQEEWKRRPQEQHLPPSPSEKSRIKQAELGYTLNNFAVYLYLIS